MAQTQNFKRKFPIEPSCRLWHTVQTVLDFLRSLLWERGYCCRIWAKKCPELALRKLFRLGRIVPQMGATASGTAKHATEMQTIPWEL